MKDMDLLLHQLECSYEKEDWYPPLGAALEGVTAAQASWRPPGAANTIWETVNHLLYYKERLLARLQGTEFFNSAQDNDDTFKVTAAPDDEQAWKDTVNRMKSVHEAIKNTLASLEEDAFDKPLPQKSLGLSVSSIIMHDAYHTGEIVQIRKMQGSWPARRSFD